MIEKAIPKALPLEAPKISGDTIGFLKTAWYVAPDTDKAAPTNRAAIIRGSLIYSKTCFRFLNSELFKSKIIWKSILYLPIKKIEIKSIKIKLYIRIIVIFIVK